MALKSRTKKASSFIFLARAALVARNFIRLDEIVSSCFSFRRPVAFVSHNDDINNIRLRLHIYLYKCICRNSLLSNYCIHIFICNSLRYKHGLCKIV